MPALLRNFSKKVTQDLCTKRKPPLLENMTLFISQISGPVTLQLSRSLWNLFWNLPFSSLLPLNAVSLKKNHTKSFFFYCFIWRPPNKQKSSWKLMSNSFCIYHTSLTIPPLKITWGRGLTASLFNIIRKSLKLPQLIATTFDPVSLHCSQNL